MGEDELTSGEKEQTKFVRLKNHLDHSDFSDSLHTKPNVPTHCHASGCQGSKIAFSDEIKRNDSLKPVYEVLAEAQDFITQYYEHKHLVNSEQHMRRWHEVKSSIEEHATYELLTDELVFGARTAWRNSSRCIGRIQWANLEILDKRGCKTAEELFEALCHHLEYAENDGNIRSTITVFKQRVGSPEKDIRVWNHQLIRYAGYRQPDGSVMGDPAEVEFTKVCETLGWKGKGGQFDVLPLVIQASGEDPKWFEIPKHLIGEVPMKHPKFKWFAGLGYKWYTVPAISCMMLDVGGIQFPAAPFNGWYMQTEIARNFCDSNRYNILPTIAKMMGLDTRSNYSLWKDEAFVEVNKAILYSYKEAGATVIDHHSASDSFMAHMTNEQKLRRGCPADWVWVVPPIGGSLCKVWHQEMLNYHLRPSYEYISDAWLTHVWNSCDMEMKFKMAAGSRKLHSFKSAASVILFCSALTVKLRTNQPKVLVLYATETGKSERYARQTGNVFQCCFNPLVKCMDDYDVSNLPEEGLVLIIASTFGNGDPPTNGAKFYSDIQQLAKEGKRLPKTKYAIFALGSSAYLNFCKFGKNVDKTLKAVNAQQILPLATGDEVHAEAEMFKKWLGSVFTTSCKVFNIQTKREINDVINSNSATDSWTLGKYHLITAKNEEMVVKGLETVHHYQHRISEAKVVNKLDLHPPQSQSDMKMSICLKLDDHVSYQPGDHVAIFPKNDPEMVAEILKRLAADADRDIPVMVELPQNDINDTQATQKTFQNTRLPACSLRTALTQYLDITTPPTPEFLGCLALLTRNSSEKSKLKVLSKGKSQFTRWRQQKASSLVDVLVEFPSLILDPTLLLTQLPVLQPRLYSVSSSPRVTPNEMTLTFSVVSYDVPNSPRPHRQGVATNFLKKVSIGEKIPIFVKPSPDFNMPSELTVPIIFLAVGSGIAPIRGFWQHLAHNLKGRIGNETYDTTLIFGCRTKETHLYEEEMENAKNAGALQNVHVAYSREPGIKKKYVQQILEEDGKNVAEKIVERKGHVYVCGGVQLAEDVHISIVEILRTHKGFTTQKAETYIDVMKTTKRYHEDVFGVLTNKYKVVEDQSSQKQKRSSKTCTLM